MHVLSSTLFLDDRIFIQGAAATPSVLIKAMAEHGKSARLENVEVVHIHTDGKAEYASKEYEGDAFKEVYQSLYDLEMWNRDQYISSFMYNLISICIKW